MMVLLPQPVGPMIPRLSPRSRVKLMSVRAFSRSSPAKPASSETAAP